MKQFSFSLCEPQLAVGMKRRFRYYIADTFQCHGREMHISVIAQYKLMHLSLKGALRDNNFTGMSMDQCRITEFQPFLHLASSSTQENIE